MLKKYDFSNLNSPLETERLKMRLIEASDIDFIYRQFSDPEMCIYFNEPPCASLEAAKAIIDIYITNPEKDKQLRWVLIRKYDNTIIGTCGYHCYDKHLRKVEIGYDIWKGFWRQGYISEALPVLLSYCFEYLGVNKVYAKIDPANIASRRSAEKSGLRVEGILREDEKKGDRFLDTLYMSILKREWKSV
jgi:ribosomal-protein-alanine N-acetyltransferase